MKATETEKATSGSRSSWLALGALALVMLTIGLDTTILVVALPTLADDLHASTSQLQWFSSSYTLILAAALLPAGVSGDRYGRKRVLLAAIVVFGLASVWCAYSGDANTLIVARAVLGLGAAGMMPLSMAVLPGLFPNPADRQRALTIWVTSTALGLPLGPIVGGWMLEHFWWGSIFLINVPLIIVGILAVVFLVPESRSAKSDPLDLPGVGLSAVGLLGITYGFIRAGSEGWADPVMWTCVVTGAAVLAIFVWWEKRARFPLVDLSLLRDRNFAGGTAFATLVNFAMFGVLFVLPQLFEAVQGTSALGAGVRLLPFIGGVVVGTRVVGLLTQRLTVGSVIATGFVSLAVGLGWAATTGADTPFWILGIAVGLTGLGMGIAMPAAMNAAMGSLDPDRAGSGSGFLQAMRQAGGTIGVAILGTVLSTGYRAGLGADDVAPISDGVSAGMTVAKDTGSDALSATVTTAFLDGFAITLAITAALCAIAAVLAAVIMRERGDSAQPIDVDGRESIHAGTAAESRQRPQD
jgi:EmrB/QacA subfamily drug resistance transporter